MPGLQNNDFAENIAQNWVQKLNSQFIFENNPKSGENLYRATSSVTWSQKPADC